jgi:hypothetical protein
VLLCVCAFECVGCVCFLGVASTHIHVTPHTTLQRCLLVVSALTFYFAKSPFYDRKCNNESTCMSTCVLMMLGGGGAVNVVQMCVSEVVSCESVRSQAANINVCVCILSLSLLV